MKEKERTIMITSESKDGILRKVDFKLSKKAEKLY